MAMGMLTRRWTTPSSSDGWCETVRNWPLQRSRHLDVCGDAGRLPGVGDLVGARHRATNPPFSVFNGSTLLQTVSINQEQAPNDFVDAGVPWENLGSFTITSGTLVVRLTNLVNEYVIADAVRIERLS